MFHFVRLRVQDLTRTFPGHEVFESPNGRAGLKRVLIAYANRNRKLGYCQGMNFIAAVLTLYYPERDAFWMLVHIVEKMLPHYFDSNMLGIQV
jgi:hypothetical protein